MIRTLWLAAILVTWAPARGLAQTSDVEDTRQPLGPTFRAPPDPAEPGITRPALPPEVERAERPRVHPWRAVLTTTLAFGLNLAWYWWDADFNQPDWDLRWDWESWKEKTITFEAVRLDGNRFSTNAGSHTEGGTIIYLIGRGNGLSPGWSTFLTFAEVVAWEYIGEFYEKPSINDMINNPLGGLAVGEPFHQLSEFFSRGADNGVNETLSTIFSPISHVNYWADGYRPRRAPALDRLGLPADVRHRFDLYAGLASARWNDGSERSETLLGVRTHLNKVSGYGRPVRRSDFFGTGRITDIDAGLSLAAEGMTGAVFATRLSLAGYHGQNLRRDGDGQLVGQSVMLYLTNTFNYTNRVRPGVPFDQIASFAVAGPTVDLSHRNGEFEATLRLEAFPELAMVTSLPHEAYKSRSGNEGLKLVMAEHGYYYGYGLNVGSQLALRYHSVEAGFDARWEQWESIEGLDRFQERLTLDLHQSDGRVRSLLWFSVRPAKGYADIRLSLDRTDRYGAIGDLRASRVERRATLTLGFAL
jgi:hypothetical protein